MILASNDKIKTKTPEAVNRSLGAKSVRETPENSVVSGRILRPPLQAQPIRNATSARGSSISAESEQGPGKSKDSSAVVGLEDTRNPYSPSTADSTSEDDRPQHRRRFVERDGFQSPTGNQFLRRPDTSPRRVDTSIQRAIPSPKRFPNPQRTHVGFQSQSSSLQGTNPSQQRANRSFQRTSFSPPSTETSPPKQKRISKKEQEQIALASLRPAAQPFPKLFASPAELRRKGIAAIAKEEEGEIDRAFDPNLNPAWNRYERFINKTSGRMFQKSAVPKKIEERVRIGPRSESPDTWSPLAAGNDARESTHDAVDGLSRSPDTASRRPDATRMLSQPNSNSVDGRLAEAGDNGTLREAEVEPAQRRSSRKDWREEFLPQYLEIAKEDPYAQFY